ncbi:MAG: gliding motility protein GldL [Spirosomataceae bacterium]
MAGRSSALFDKVLPVVYSLGAAVVILGALFKIRHLEGADVMLTVGMGVEALIFALFALQTFVQPPSREYEWEKVYPELADDYKGALPTKSNEGKGLTANMDKMLADAKVTPDIFDNLGKSMRSLTDTVGKIKDISDATVATNEYAKNAKTAASSMLEMNKSYGVAMTALGELANTSTDAKEYRAQFQQITKNMGALNAVYELELQDTNRHLKAMNAFYGNLTTAMENMAEASKDAQKFKSEMTKLTSNLTSLNNVYGGMLSAMKGN